MLTFDLGDIAIVKGICKLVPSRILNVAKVSLQEYVGMFSKRTCIISTMVYFPKIYWYIFQIYWYIFQKYIGIFSKNIPVYFQNIPVYFTSIFSFPPRVRCILGKIYRYILGKYTGIF